MAETIDQAPELEADSRAATEAVAAMVTLITAAGVTRQAVAIALVCYGAEILADEIGPPWARLQLIETAHNLGDHQP